jgi:hypothetical protein
MRLLFWSSKPVAIYFDEYSKRKCQKVGYVTLHVAEENLNKTSVSFLTCIEVSKKK